MGNSQSNALFISQYSISPQEIWRNERGWKLYDAVNKQSSREDPDNGEVSVFVYTPNPEQSGDTTSSLFSLALNFHKRFKTLRHPCLLPYRDGAVVGDKIYIVTERVVPLQHKLPELTQYPWGLSWGIYQIAEALSFLHSLDLIHGCVELNSIFVTRRQDWRLCVMDLVTSITDLRQGIREALLSPSIDLDKKATTPPELLLFISSEEGRNNDVGNSERGQINSSAHTTANILNSQQLRNSQPTHAIDAWQFGCLLYTLFAPSHTLMQRSELKNVHILPKPLHEQYMRLISASPQNRLTLDAFLAGSTYFVNPLCETCQFLETIQLKDQYEKENFWRKLPNLLKDIPTAYAKHKILPHLIQAMEFGSAHVRVLSPLFTIGKELTDEEYATILAPHIVKWFAMEVRSAVSPDVVNVTSRIDPSDADVTPVVSIRSTLLENIEEYIHRIPAVLINEQLFPKIILGLADPHPYLRELTVKALVPLAKYLPSKTLNEQVLKGLARVLQSDPIPSIRANVVVAVGLMAPHMPLTTAKSVLLPCFSRALRDPHPLVRLVGVKGIAATAMPASPYYTPQDIALRLVPTLSSLTLDSDPHTRSLTLQTLKALLTLLEQNHEQMTKEKTPLQEPGGKSAETQRNQSVLSWAFSSLAKKLYSNEQFSNQKPQQSPPPQPQQPQQNLKSTSSNTSVANALVSVPNKATQETRSLNLTKSPSSLSASSTTLSTAGSSNNALPYHETVRELDETLSPNSDDSANFKQSSRSDKDGWDTFDNDWDFTINNERETKIDTKNKTKSL
jgi:SCY1-like protein 1